MGKAETGITDTGERGNPLAQKVRRTTTGWQDDPQAEMADGIFPKPELRKAPTLNGNPPTKGR